jgi:methionine aminopeptidase
MINAEEKAMPMIYVSEKTKDLLDKIVEALRKNTNTPARILKTDAIHAAVEEYAKKLGVKE